CQAVGWTPHRSCRDTSTARGPGVADTPPGPTPPGTPVSAVTTPRPQRRGGQGRCDQWRTVVAVDGAEASTAVPLLASPHDLLVAAAHEVPPHHDPLLERFPAQQQQTARLFGTDQQVGTAGTEVE